MLPSKQLLLNYIIHILPLNKTEYKIKFKKKLHVIFILKKIIFIFKNVNSIVNSNIIQYICFKQSTGIF